MGRVWAGDGSLVVERRLAELHGGVTEVLPVRHELLQLLVPPIADHLRLFLLLGTLAAHEACGLHSAAAETMRSPMRRAAPSPASPNEESSPIPYQRAEVVGL